MDYGRIKKSDALVHVADAVRGVGYVCPTCGQPLELRRGPDLEYFAHWRGLEGTRECELFVPGQGPASKGGTGPRVPVEDDPPEPPLIVDELEGEWRVGLKLPEIPHDELGAVPLSELRPARVEITAGGAVVSSTSALDLRPGVGAARISVPPTLQDYRARAAGSWPRTIDTLRWQLRSRGLEAKGTLFRLRGGEWTRLLVGSAVYHGERLLVLADSNWPPPAAIMPQVQARLPGDGLEWGIWEVLILDDPAAVNVTSWLDRIGHSLVRRPWSITLATPARTYGEHGEPVFWLGDSPLLVLEAPMPGAEAMATLAAGSNSHSASVRVANDYSTHVLLEPRSPGPSSFRVTADRSARIDLTFVQRPTHAAVLDLLANTPRLRVWIGDRSFEPWRGYRHTLRLGTRESPEIRVDLGGDDERARVTVWERGKQRSYHGLSAREVSTTVGATLAVASLVEIDADNLGRIELAPATFTGRNRDKGAARDRLTWRNHVASMLAEPGEETVPTVLQRPRIASGLVTRFVGATALISARLALRRRRGTGDALS